MEKSGNLWEIFYSERGSKEEPIFSSISETDACEFFYNHILSMEHLHIIGFFKEESSANELENKLSNIGVRIIRNDIPAFMDRNDPRFRLFVIGKDIFKVKEVIPVLPIGVT